jgi:hypothetical protein
MAQTVNLVYDQVKLFAHKKHADSAAMVSSSIAAASLAWSFPG